MTYHAVMRAHEHLPVLVLCAAASASIVVVVRVARARSRAATLFSLSTPLPINVVEAFDIEAARLTMRLPRIAYLDVTAPLCFVMVGVRPAVVLSRGFIEDLPQSDVRMVIRHELLHVKHADPLRGFAWHIAFAALLLPAFSQLERWLADRRELRTNLETSCDDPVRYAALLRTRSGNRADLCAETSPPAERPANVAAALVQPAIVVAVLAGLAYSHAWFLKHLAFLSTHHC